MIFIIVHGEDHGEPYDVNPYLIQYIKQTPKGSCIRFGLDSSLYVRESALQIQANIDYAERREKEERNASAK